MSEWTDPEPELADSFAAVEELLEMAAEAPALRSGLKDETITRAQRVQREVRFQQMLWGGVASVLLFFGALLARPSGADSALAANAEPDPKPTDTTVHSSSDAVDWELVESKNQLRRRNLEILRNAF